jgi:hypothetical protein
MSNPNIMDLNAIMKAAAEAATNMQQTTSSNNEAPPADATPIPSLSMPTAEQIQQTMANLNIGTVLDRMAAAPGQTSQLMAESMGSLPPEMMEQAKKLSQGGQADRILREMQKRGMNPHQMKAEMEQQQKTMKALNPKKMGPTKKALIVTLNRQVKSRAIPPDCGESAVAPILHCQHPVEISCSRLALGPWADKTIKVWYDGDLKGKNKRASKIVGFPVAGDIIIHAEDDLLESDLIEVEKQLE